MPIYQVPPDALWSSANVLVRSGFLQPRPGLTELAATVMSGQPTGMFNAPQLATGAFQADAFQNDAFQVAGSVASSLLMVGTTREIYILQGSTLVDISPTQTATVNQLARFTSMALGTPQVIYVIHTNGVDAPLQYDATSAVFGAMTGTPPLWTDVCNISEHIIGIRPPFDILWGNTQVINTWPAANTRVLSDTPDVLRAIASLGVRAGVVYKSNSLWDVVVTGSETESEFFRFEMRAEVEGPASPAAVVNASGAHVYMTDTGRIGYYNGSRHLWVADGIWPLVQADLDLTNVALIFGAYDPLYRVVVFAYPKTGDSGVCKGWAMVMLPNPKEGYKDFISFHGSSALGLSAGGDLRFNQFKALLATSTAGAQKLYTWEGADDAGTAITGHLQTGLLASPGLEFFGVDAYETLALRGAGYGTLTVKPVSSFILGTEGGTVGTGKTLDLTSDTVLGGPKGADIRGRFFGLRYEFTTPLTLRWLGARLAAKLRKG